MKAFSSPTTAGAFAIKALALAIASQSPLVHAAPTGGAVVAGTGTINQSGTNTTINQSTERLSLEWNTFNVAGNERVQFIQPGTSSVALNRILDSSGSQILGRIDANGHVILMNPNGVFFGANATVNVGGLVASGLNIDTDDFMNGDLVFAGLEGTAGAVVNRGIINAATGGNVALIGKSVANRGLISASLGHVVLASGSEAVVTFDDEGLIGVRIDKETLASEVGGTYAVTNAGTIEAKGGKILLNASVSADLFSEAVNHGGMNGGTEAVLHDDGSFTLGSGNSVINTGVVNVSTDAATTADAGYVVMAGQNVEQRGTIRANAEGDKLAGQVYLESFDQVRMTSTSLIEANADVTSGKISFNADNLLSTTGAKLSTSGDVLASAYVTVRLPEMLANHLYVSSIGTVRQTGAATVTGNTHVYVAAGADVRLTNVGNDFNSFSLDADHTSNTHLTESNSIHLNDLDLEDSSLQITALGQGSTVQQNPGTRINVGESSLRITADNILLGEDGGTTDVYNGLFHLTFGQSIATNGSVTLHEYGGGLYANDVRIVGKDLGYGNVYLDLRADKLIDLNADLDVDMRQLVVHQMAGKNASLIGYSETTQTGPIYLSGALNWNSYIAQLDNPENDIASLQGTGEALAFGWLTYVDKNDIVIRNLQTGEETSVNISSVGDGATIKQAANTTLKVDFIDLAADNILLGANGLSDVRAGYYLKMNFQDNLIINGSYSIGSSFPYFGILGDENNNRLVFGEHATAKPVGDAYGGITIDLGAGDDIAIFNSELIGGTAENKLNMGSGNDRVYFNRDVYLPLVLGAGSDLVRIWDMETHYEATDFDSGEDVLIVYNP